LICEEDGIISRLVKIGYSTKQAENIYFQYLQWNKLPSLLDFIREKEMTKSLNKYLLQSSDYLE